MRSDPLLLIENARMSVYQYIAVGICILLMAIDGFDVLAISFAAPGLAEEWEINRAALGIVLAAELIGMGVGSVVLGGVADHYGRRKTIICCIFFLSVFMCLASLVNSVNQLLAVRLATGLAIGGILPAINAAVAELSNKRNRSLFVIFMGGGYSVGAVLGGLAASELLVEYTWRSVFVFGGVITAIFLPIVWFFLPESISYLMKAEGHSALDKINQTLARFGHDRLDMLPPAASNSAANKSSYHLLFSDKLRLITIFLMLAFFLYIMAFYFFLKWIPKIVFDMGYQAHQAGSVLVWANVGGIIGCFLLGILAGKGSLIKLLSATLLFAGLTLIMFGVGYDSLEEIKMMATLTGFFISAGVVGFYALIAKAFPAEIRASGTGIVLGFGRGGAALGPVFAGVLFYFGFSLLTISIVMAAAIGTATMLAILVDRKLL